MRVLKSAPSPRRFFFLTLSPHPCSGSINTLSTKAADLQTATNRYGNNAYFSHPFVQALGMFFGELSCLFVYLFLSYRAKAKNDESFQRAKPHSKLIFLIPAMCDMTAVRHPLPAPPPCSAPRPPH